MLCVCVRLWRKISTIWAKRAWMFEQNKRKASKTFPFFSLCWNRKMTFLWFSYRAMSARKKSHLTMKILMSFHRIFITTINKRLENHFNLNFCLPTQLFSGKSLIYPRISHKIVSLDQKGFVSCETLIVLTKFHSGHVINLISLIYLWSWIHGKLH